MIKHIDMGTELSVFQLQIEYYLECVHCGDRLGNNLVEFFIEVPTKQLYLYVVNRSGDYLSIMFDNQVVFATYGVDFVTISGQGLEYEDSIKLADLQFSTRLGNSMEVPSWGTHTGSWFKYANDGDCECTCGDVDEYGQAFIPIYLEMYSTDINVKYSTNIVTASHMTLLVSDLTLIDVGGSVTPITTLDAQSPTHTLDYI